MDKFRIKILVTWTMGLITGLGMIGFIPVDTGPAWILVLTIGFLSYSLVLFVWDR